MKILVILCGILYSVHFTAPAGTLFYLQATDTIPDTVTVLTDSAEKTIQEVIKTRSLPKAEKVQYVSQVTKYGFKSLFRNFSYNSAMPYASQVNPYAENFMQDYLQAHGSYLKKMKGSSQLYFNLIDNIFSQYGLPRELKYLAVIESDLKPQALSWMGARGPWQFMTYTARDYRLLVNGYVDERVDYYKSTGAAARYLLSLYKDLKDWLLVIAAYNGGPGKVYSAIKKSGSRNFWSLQYYLPTESRNHVKKFIATHYIMETDNPGITGVDYAGIADTAKAQIEMANVETLGISGKYNSVVLCKNLALDINEFNRLNPGFDFMLTSGNLYNLRLPPDKMDLFVANKYIILNECVQILLNDVNNPSPVKTSYNRPLPSKGSKKK